MPKQHKMQVKSNISPNEQHKTLKDFIPLVFAFFGCMVLLSVYQNLRLYFDGVLDSFINKSLFILLLHHSGFLALTAVILAFLFNYLERRKPNLGFNVTKIVLSLLILIEGALIEHYIQNYEVLGYGMFSFTEVVKTGYSIIPILITLVVTVALFHWLGKITKLFYNVVSRMYPFTIVLFSLFLATLNSNKKPINENKTQHYVESAFNHIFDFNKYHGTEEYPLVKTHKSESNLSHHLKLTETKPNIVVLIVDGLGTDFIGKNSKYNGFTPFLESIKEQSLYWENHLSNTGESFATLPTIMGSLPFGQKGFTNLSNTVNRQTLFSILKENGYTTSFNYGGNSGLNGIDRFLDEERVDEILDKKGFGKGYTLQKKDAAGISLGYPDKELFRKWQSQEINTTTPRFDVFMTLSTKNPFLIPDMDMYEEMVDKVLASSDLDKRALKLVDRNKEVFASLLYADSAIEGFLNSFKSKEEFNNTIFVITGSHNLKDLPQENNLGRYRVPLMVYGSLVKSPKTINGLVSHVDIAPSIISMLESEYEMKIPKQVAWLGNELVLNEMFKTSKQIPLFRDVNTIQDYIYEDLFVTRRSVFQLNTNLDLGDADDDKRNNMAKDNFKHFKAVNKYVTANNKILPQSQAIYAKANNQFTKAELIWIESVFNGNDFDNAYKTARGLAIDNDWDRSLLLANYILNKIPRHADTEVLIGRIYSWKKDYTTSIEVLSEAIRKYPTYTDAYSALLDTYFWANRSEEATALFKTVSRNKISSPEIDEKLVRAKEQIRKNALDRAKKVKNLVSINN